jgi:periplasmic divalent cation tolerance protein
MAWCPFPDSESAESSVNSLLDEGLAACANILPGMRSIFVWQGQREKAEEVGVLLDPKLTNSALLQPLVSRLEQLHPYDEPAIMAWHCDHFSAATAQWLGGLT